MNGTGTGGLRVNGRARPNALFSGGGADPVDVKVANVLTAARLAGLTGTGGYLTPAPADATFTLPAGGDWAANVPVGLKVVNSNAGGADVALSGDFTHNVLVDAGATLNANGARLGPAAASAILGRVSGTGTLAGAVINTGGVVAPGTSAGTLAATGGLSILGTYQAEVTGPGAGQTDLLAVTGGLTLGPASVLDVTGGTFNGTSTYTIASYDTLAGQFQSQLGLPSNYEVNYGSGSNGTISLVPVPEPAGVALAAGAGLLLLRRRNRRGTPAGLI